MTTYTYQGLRDVILHNGTSKYVAIYDTGIEFTAIKEIKEVPLSDIDTSATPDTGITDFKKILNHYLLSGYITEQGLYTNGTGWSEMATITNDPKASKGSAVSITVANTHYTVFTAWSFVNSRQQAVTTSTELKDTEWVRIGEGDDAELCQVSSVDSDTSFVADLMNDHAKGTKVWRALRSVKDDLYNIFYQNDVVSFEIDQETVSGKMSKYTLYPVKNDGLVPTKYKIKGTFVWGRDM